MQKERKDTSFIKQPIFKGGIKAMRELITVNLIYPEDAILEKVEGTVFLRYDIDYKGKVIGTKVLSSLGHGCDEEAIRLVHLFKFEIPKGPRKIKVIFHKTIKIHFRLPQTSPDKSQLKTESGEITYTVTSSKAEEGKKEQNNNYQYSITWQ